MAGTSEGGKRAGQTNLKRHGADFYKRIGAIGGAKGHTGGFYVHRDLARIAGAKGGRNSKRTGVKNGEGKIHLNEPVKIDHDLLDAMIKDKE